MASDEMEFPFNVKNFQKAVDQMEKSISSMENKLGKFGTTMQKSVSKGITSATAKIGILVKGFRAITKNMPEIGQAFKIAGDIMGREFLFPIRQLLMPYLQKMLDWVRDHRALFAKWGTAVADNMKIVIRVVKSLYQTLQKLTEILTDSLQRGLKTSFKSLDEFISVLQVKIAFITLMIGDVIQGMFDKVSPVFSYIVETGAEVINIFRDLFSEWVTGNDTGKILKDIFDILFQIFDKIVHVIGDALKSFFQGLIQPLKDLSGPLGTIKDAFQRLLDLFGDGDNNGIKGAFKWLGNFVGNQLLSAFIVLAVAIDTVVSGIQTLAQGGKLLKDVFTGDWDALKTDWEGVKNIWKDYGERSKANFTELMNAQANSVGIDNSIDDGIVTKDGQVIKINPDDNVYAFKGSPMGGGITAPMNMVFNVTVTEGNAQIAGQQFGSAIHDTLVDRLQKQQMAGGW